VFGWEGDVYGHWFAGIDDSGGLIGVDLRQAAQKQAADVGENGSAAGRNAVLGQEPVEVHEGKVDPLCGLEVLEITAEVRVMVSGFLFHLFGAMLRTESGACVGHGKTASTTAGSAMGATDC